MPPSSIFSSSSSSSSSRWCPTPEQLMILEEMYRAGVRTPNSSQIQHITAQLSHYGKIEGKNVFYWFQNHKARDRQKLRRKLCKQLHMQQQQLYHNYYNTHHQHHNQQKLVINNQQGLLGHLNPPPPTRNQPPPNYFHHDYNSFPTYLPQLGVEDASMKFTGNYVNGTLGASERSEKMKKMVTNMHDWTTKTTMDLIGPSSSPACCISDLLVLLDPSKPSSSSQSSLMTKIMKKKEKKLHASSTSNPRNYNQAKQKLVKLRTN